MPAGYPSDWGQRRTRVLKQDNYTCQSCGRKGGWGGSAELHVHHILPKSRGGNHKLENLTTVCDRCHAEFHNDERLRAEEQNPGLLARLFFGSSDDRKQERAEGVDELRKWERRRKQMQDSSPMDYWEQQVEAAYNETFDGCAECGRELLTVNWRSRGNGQAKVIECDACGATYAEQVANRDGERGLSLREIDDVDEIEPVPSAFVYELEKHAKLGSFENRDIEEFKQKLLEEVNSDVERELIETKFEEFDGFDKTQLTPDVQRSSASKAPEDGESVSPDHRDAGMDASGNFATVDWVDGRIPETDPPAIRRHFEDSYQKSELQDLLHRALRRELDGELPSSLRNDFMRAFFRRIDEPPEDIELQIEDSYRELVNDHGEKYALATALNHYFSNREIRERAAVKSLSKTVLASMLTAIYLHDTSTNEAR